jgi:hypothetical protein
MKESAKERTMKTIVTSDIQYSAKECGVRKHQQTHIRREIKENGRKRTNEKAP